MRLFWKEAKPPPANPVIEKRGGTIWSRIRPPTVDTEKLSQLFENRTKEVAPKVKKYDFFYFSLFFFIKIFFSFFILEFGIKKKNRKIFFNEKFLSFVFVNFFLKLFFVFLCIFFLFLNLFYVNWKITEKISEISFEICVI